jgi:hypothetical protein
MKKIIFILLLAVSVVSCQKETAEQRQVISTEPIAEITKTTKVFAGSNPSVKIDYTLTNTANVESIKLNNVLDVVVKDGNGVTYEPAAGFTNNRFYFWVFNLKDGKQIITNPKQYWF